jgi:hypothetical protein
MQATAAGAQARVAPEGAAVPIFAVALMKSGPELLIEYTASAAIRKCLGKNLASCDQTQDADQIRHLTCNKARLLRNGRANSSEQQKAPTGEAGKEGS